MQSKNSTTEEGPHIKNPFSRATCYVFPLFSPVITDYELESLRVY